MTSREARSFETAAELDRWLKRHHDKEPELWVRVFKKGSGTPSVTWDECVVAALTWGWIDGLRRSLDDVSYLQRLTPRRARSTWSKRNCEIAERLIAEGRMRPAGLRQVEAARQDGRWEQAYAGSAEMTLPEDFLKALKDDAAAKAAFEALSRAEVFSIYHQLHSAKRPETRERRLRNILARLASGEGARPGKKP